MAAVTSGLTAADVAEVSEAIGASHMVAPHRSLHSGLAHRTHLVINAPSQACQVARRLLRPPRDFCGPAPEMRDDVVVRLIYLLRALHAVCLHTRAAASEGGLAAGDMACESADEHADRAVAIQTMLGGNCPLRLLHIEEGLVDLSSLLSTEQCRWKRARVEHRATDFARVAVRGIQHHVHALLEAGEAIVIFPDAMTRLGVGSELVHAGSASPGGSGGGGGVVGSAGHCV